MTDESEGQTEDWIEKFEAEYPYAYYSGSDLPKFAKVSGIPAAILVDPSGRVVWKGHPGNLNGSILEPFLDGSLPVPLYDFPKEASSVKKAILKDDLEKALTEAKEIEAEGVDLSAEIRAAVEGMIANRVGQLKAAYERGDFLSVETDGEALVDSLGDLPEGVEVAEIVGRVEDDDDAQDVIKAQKKIADIREDMEEMRKAIEASRAIEKLRKLIEDVPGTYAETEARELMDQLDKLRLNLR